MSVDGASVRKMILWPAVITFAITMIRLVGELQNWSPSLFSRQAGGGVCERVAQRQWLRCLYGEVRAFGVGPFRNPGQILVLC